MRIALTIVLLVVLTCSPKQAWSFAVSTSKPLLQSAVRADVIIEARLEKYVPDPTDQMQWKPQKGIPGLQFFSTGSEGFIAMSTVKLRGAYTFGVLRTLKGQCDPTLQITLPRVLSHIYGDVRIPVEQGKQFLLLLKRDSNAQWAPVDSMLPLIPIIGDQMLDATNGNDASPQSSIVSLLLTSLTDPVLRQANTYLLRDNANLQSVAGLAPYIDDPNPRVRDNVLHCMAVNGQVAVIPRIAQFAAEQAKKREGANSVIALQNFNTPEAVPYLNPLLFETDQYVRINAMSALSRIANRSSIPYFLLALYDPEPQRIVAPSAAAMLHRLAPELGEPQGEDYFTAHRDEETRKLFAWWRDELSGKHPLKLKRGEEAPIPKTMSNLSRLKPDEIVAQLNPLLFELSAPTRRAAMEELQKRADRSSVPYLLLALQDPDQSVAYGAYQALRRLVPLPGSNRDAATFFARFDEQTKPFYAWWQDELSGKHLPPTKDGP